ncbi:MAG TPA: SGNH/GDSL hydrolase family protein [Candidatus Saccharimonadales bacterium]|nr:SGNH/GDSL hydrolase family protein [Candidatus Saccharimonadales bacterium]
MRIFKLITLLIVAFMIVAAGLLPAATASAASYDGWSLTKQIQCALRAGSDFDFQSALQCTGKSKNNGARSSNPGALNQTMPPKTAPRPTYAALGDSVAAGAGLPSAANASAQDIQCDRSTQAYPRLVARKAGYALIDKACSGATAGDLVTQQHIKGPNPAAQLDGAFARGTPALITITAGANDAHWEQFIRACYATTCNTESYTLAANAFLVALQTKLYYVFYAIQARSHGQPPQVIVTGYYNPLSDRCSALQQDITPNEINWLSAETAALNQTLQQVTDRFSFAQFVPISFTGHDICAPSPWVQSLSDPAPFHPTATGQQVISRQILRTLNN